MSEAISGADLSIYPACRCAHAGYSFIMQHAYSITEYLLSSGKRLADGETIGVEGQARFKISHADVGDFVSFPIARLSLQAKT
jgi:hypothetical protein